MVPIIHREIHSICKVFNLLHGRLQLRAMNGHTNGSQTYTEYPAFPQRNVLAITGTGRPLIFLLLQAWILFFSLILSALYYWRVFTINKPDNLFKVNIQAWRVLWIGKTHYLFFCWGLYFQLINRFLVFRYIFCVHYIMYFVFCVLWLSRAELNDEIVLEYKLAY